MKTKVLSALLIIFIATSAAVFAQNYSIGVYYYPGWRSDYINWKDIKGAQDSKSPGKPWPERQPLLGYYPEEEPWVADKHIAWASQYGINFIAYDWYWNGVKPEYDHALKNFISAKNTRNLQFTLLWDNLYIGPASLVQFDNMTSYWINNYFNKPAFYRIDNKPVIFVYSVGNLETNAKTFGETAKTLLARANGLAKIAGYAGIYFVSTTNERPSDIVEKWLLDIGFNAYTGWNYVGANSTLVDDYDVMVNGYLDYYNAAAQTSKLLPYIVPVSPGWDSRPWHGNDAQVRSNPTPEKFTRMLISAKQLMDNNAAIPKILMIESWNEFAEGSVIEPTKKWGFSYLEAIKKVFGTTSASTGKK